jgi:outer membrane lipoprotein carrier protein
MNHRVNRISLIFGLALLNGLLPVAAVAQDLEPAPTARGQLERFSAGLETLQARFEQQVVSNDGAVDEVTGGEVWLQRPQRFRWEYGGNFPQLVVADGQRVWIYDVALEQVTVEDQAVAAADSPLTLLTDPGRLDEQFEVREAGDVDGLQFIELSTRSAESEFERVLLGLRNDNLELMIMEDAFGLRTELRFLDVERNPELDHALFTFVPPEGADVIGDVAIVRPLGEP